MAKLTAEQLAERNADIIKRHLAGHGNKLIGASIGLHLGNVAKIIKAARDSGALGSAKGNGQCEHGDPLPLPVRESGRRRSGKSLKRRFKNGKATAIPKRKQDAKPRTKSKRAGLSLLDAAHIILRRAKGGPLHPLVIVERALAGGLWHRMKGKTPSATLWSRMLAEIKLGPAKSRFKLSAPGQFGLTAHGLKCEMEKADAT